MLMELGLNVIEQPSSSAACHDVAPESVQIVSVVVRVVRGMTPTSPTEASRALRAWCDGRRGRQTRLAREVGVTITTVAHWCSGGWRPRPQHWDAIEKFTGGDVPAGLWRGEALERIQPRVSLTPDEMRVVAACLVMCEPRMTPEGQQVVREIGQKLRSLGVVLPEVPDALRE